ncbi:MAG: GWxTD domain-containing protein [Bacteroidales bacterium]
MKKYFVVILLLFVLFFSCRFGKIATQNLSYLYDKDMSPFIPGYTVFHKNDTVSLIYFKIYSGSLLYVRPVEEDIFSAKFSLKAELYDSPARLRHSGGYDMKLILDSNSVTITDNDRDNKRDIIETLEIKTKSHGSYLLKLIFADLNKHTTVESYINIYRNSPYGRQNFIMLNVDSLPFYNPWISGEQQFRLVSNNKKINKLFVRYYGRIFPIAVPSFSTISEKSFDFDADSIFTVPLENGSTALMKLVKKGYYHFQIDTTTKEGYTVFRFDEGFPRVTTPAQMLYPLRYLTSKYEYDDLIVMKNKKEAVDKFWAETAGNVDRAKELIKLYYNRVQEANRYFTSYIEGWKTDRGIIYIVYGHPNVVYRGKNMENWVYGEARNMLSITFSFYKIENPFTDNDYSLSRSPAYKDGWYIAVDNWRR